MILRIICPQNNHPLHVFVSKNLGSAPSTKVFLILHESFDDLALKAS